MIMTTLRISSKQNKKEGSIHWNAMLVKDLEYFTSFSVIKVFFLLSFERVKLKLKSRLIKIKRSKTILSHTHTHKKRDKWNEMRKTRKNKRLRAGAITLFSVISSFYVFVLFFHHLLFVLAALISQTILYVTKCLCRHLLFP